MTASTPCGSMEGRFEDTGTAFVARPVGQMFDTLVDSDSQETLACTPPFEGDGEIHLEETTGFGTQTMDSDVCQPKHVESIAQGSEQAGPYPDSKPKRLGSRLKIRGCRGSLLDKPCKIQPNVGFDVSVVSKLVPCMPPRTDVDTAESDMLTTAGDGGPTLLVDTTLNVATCPQLVSMVNASSTGVQDVGTHMGQTLELADMPTLNTTTDMYCATVPDASSAGDVGLTLWHDEIPTLRTVAGEPQVATATDNLAGEVGVTPTMQLIDMPTITDATAASSSDVSPAGTLLDPLSATATVLDSIGCAAEHGWRPASRESTASCPGVSSGHRSSTALDITGHGDDVARPSWPSKDRISCAAGSASDQLQRTPELLPGSDMWSTGEMKLADTGPAPRTMSSALCPATSISSRPVGSPAPTETMQSDVWMASPMPLRHLPDERLEPVPDEQPDAEKKLSRPLRSDLSQSTSMKSGADPESLAHVRPANIDFTATVSCDESPHLIAAETARPFGRPCSESTQTTSSWSFGRRSASMEVQVVPHVFGLAASNSQVTADGHSPGRSSNTSESNRETLILGGRTQQSNEQVEQILANSVSHARASSASAIPSAAFVAAQDADRSGQQNSSVATQLAANSAVAASCEALHEDQCSSAVPPETSCVEERMLEEMVDDLPATLREPDTPLESEGSFHPSMAPSPPRLCSSEALANLEKKSANAARQPGFVPPALHSGDRKSRTRLTGKQSFVTHLALQGSNAPASARATRLKQGRTEILSRSAASGLQASQGQSQPAVASSVPLRSSAIATATSSTASGSQAPPREQHFGTAVQGVPASGHSLMPLERDAPVIVRGDGWGGGSGEYLATITEADEFTFTVIRAAEGEDESAWEETHVLREHATVLPTWPAGKKRRRVLMVDSRG